MLTYLLGLFKEVPRETIADLCRKTPGVLIDNMPVSKVKIILAEQRKLGATARFLPDPEPSEKPKNRALNQAFLIPPVGNTHFTLQDFSCGISWEILHKDDLADSLKLIHPFIDPDEHFLFGQVLPGF